MDTQLAARVPFEQHQMLGIANRQCFEHDRVDDAEYGGVRADAKRQRKHRHGGEAGIPRQHAQSIKDVAAPARQQCDFAVRTKGAVFNVMLPNRHSRFLSSLRFLQLMRQGVPIADVPTRDIAGPLLACAQPERFGVRVLQLAREFLDNLRFALGTKTPQAQVPSDMCGPIKHGWAARSG